MGLPRCNKHTNAPDLPRLCHTCQRIAVEHDLVIMTLQSLTILGYQFREHEDGKFTDTVDQTLDLLFNLDMARVITKRKDGHYGWILFVFGNDGWDVISNYTTSLEAVIGPIIDYANALAN